MNFIFTKFFFLICFFKLSYSKFSNNTVDALKAAKLPPCAACKLLTDSFNKGMDATSRGKFDGGDSAWEEEKMNGYKYSEVRLVEIQETICDEVDRGQSQCYTNNEEHERLIEEWWFKHQREAENLYHWLCINKLKVCCPDNHFGAKCLPCIGGTDNLCSGNGKCKGGGTRKGNGECECNKGYRGDVCNECALNFFKAYQDDTKVLCDPCNNACDGHCSGPGAKSCIKCKDGWTMETDHGCLDVNECISYDDICKNTEFCVNKDGTYECLKCHNSCDGCTGDGPDMCEKCTDGFELQEDTCVNVVDQKNEEHLQFARYVTYAGLTVATCIIFQKHTVIAAFIGLFVASYISFSEYYLTHMSDTNANAPLPIDMSASKFRRE